MDVGRAFVFPFEDSDWVKKLLVIAIISLIPVVGQVWLLGWSTDITRRVIRKDTVQLAGFDNLGDQLVLGLKAFVIGFVYAIPMFIFASPIPISSVFAGSDSADTVIPLVSVCCGCLLFIYGILLAFIIPAAFGELAATDKLGSAIHPGRILELLRGDFGSYIIAALIAIIAGFIGGLGIILCVVGVIFTMAYAYAIIGYVYGQAYLKATETA
ncbi:MAG: DUF4013 domain-containing protein [Anaerolineales bacterium]